MELLTNETGSFNESMVQEYTANYNETIIEYTDSTSILHNLSYIFKGPLTVFIVVVGVIFNIITLYNLNLNLVLRKKMRLMRVREMMNLSSAGQIETQRLTSGSCDSPAPLSPTKNQPFRYPK